MARKPDQTVVISGGRIAAVGEARRVRIPDGAQVINAANQFLIPGLWDMHVHLLGGNWNIGSTLDLFIANGVTGVRDMGSNSERIVPLRQEIAAGSRLGPRLVVSGNGISGLTGSADARRPISPAEARQQVRLRKQSGVDFIKLYSYLSPAAFVAAMDGAKTVGLAAVGHVPFEVKASEAAKGGFSSIEHLEGMVLEATDIEDILRDEIVVRIRERKQGIQVAQIETDQTERYRDNYSPRRLQELSALFVKYRTWHTPTFIAPESAARVVEALNKALRIDLQKDDWIRAIKQPASRQQFLWGSGR